MPPRPPLPLALSVPESPRTGPEEDAEGAVAVEKPCWGAAGAVGAAGVAAAGVGADAAGVPETPVLAPAAAVVVEVVVEDA